MSNPNKDSLRIKSTHEGEKNNTNSSSYESQENKNIKKNPLHFKNLMESTLIDTKTTEMMKKKENMKLKIEDIHQMKRSIKDGLKSNTRYIINTSPNKTPTPKTFLKNNFEYIEIFLKEDFNTTIEYKYFFAFKSKEYQYCDIKDHSITFNFLPLIPARKKKKKKKIIPKKKKKKKKIIPKKKKKLLT